MSLDPALLSLLTPAARAALLAHVNEKKQADGQTKPNDKQAGVDEDFGKSQFWYTKDTATKLAREALTLGGKVDSETTKKRIVFISCPSAYRACVDLMNEKEKATTEAILFEYDRRFAKIFGDKFVFYDFNEFDKFPSHLVGTCDFVMADPPYLNPDCARETSKTMRLLARSSSTPLVFNSGSVLASAMSELGFKESKFHPKHSCNLVNEFSTYTTYKSEAFGGFEDDEGGDSKTK